MTNNFSDLSSEAQCLYNNADYNEALKRYEKLIFMIVS